MKNVLILLVGLAIAFSASLLAGCATVVDGTTQKMTFQTNPEDVIVTLVRNVPIEGAHWAEKDRYGKPKPVPVREERRILGKTPFTLSLDRAEGQSVGASDRQPIICRAPFMNMCQVSIS